MIEGQSARAACEAKAYAQPENAAYIESASNQARDRADELMQLIAQVDSAPNMKAATDLANRIAAEQAMLQNEQTMVNLALAQRQSQVALMTQQRAEAARKRRLENNSNFHRLYFFFGLDNDIAPTESQPRNARQPRHGAVCILDKNLLGAH